MGDFTTWIGPGFGFGGAVLISLGRVPTVNRRILGLFEPLARWWTRGNIVDSVRASEMTILQRRVEDADIIQAYLIYATRWMVSAQLETAARGLSIDPPTRFDEYRTQWLRKHPGYIAAREMRDAKGHLTEADHRLT